MNLKYTVKIVALHQLEFVYDSHNHYKIINYNSLQSYL